MKNISTNIAKKSSHMGLFNLGFQSDIRAGLRPVAMELHYYIVGTNEAAWFFHESGLRTHADSPHSF